MNHEELVKHFVEHLMTNDEFDRHALTAGFNDRGGRAQLALWYAQEVAAERGRRFVAVGNGVYRVATSPQRVKRVRRRKAAATRILRRSLKELRNIDPSMLSDKDRGTIRRIEERTSDMLMRSRVADRDAKKQRPKGL